MHDDVCAETIVCRLGEHLVDVGGFDDADYFFPVRTIVGHGAGEQVGNDSAHLIASEYLATDDSGRAGHGECHVVMDVSLDISSFFYGRGQHLLHQFARIETFYSSRNPLDGEGAAPHIVDVETEV